MNQDFLDRQQQPYHVRDARPQDAATIIRILNRVAAEGLFIADEEAAFSVEQQAALIQHSDPKRQCLLVAEQAGEVAGTLEMVRGVLNKNQHTATFGMVLLPEYRHRALGEGLLRVAERWAQTVGIIKISLAVFSTNASAIRLYERLGYVEEGRRFRQYLVGGQWCDEIWMARWLDVLK